MHAAVTGAEGFIGSHLVEHLVVAGAQVRAMVLYNSFNSRGWLDTLPEDIMANVEVVAGDVRDSGSVLGLIEGVDVVYHLAALIAIPYSYRAPRSYLDTNATGTLNVLEAVRTHRTPRLVHTSTSEVYGTAIRVPIDESHPLQAQSPYAASKIAADKLVEAYTLSFGTPAVTLRPFNTYGPRQSTRAVIPTVITQIAAGWSTIHLGALDPVRDFMHVHDTVAAFAEVAAADGDRVLGRVLNAGTGAGISIGDLASEIGRLMGRDVEVESDASRLRPDASEVRQLVCDSSELQARTGWRPTMTLEAGLGATIDWYRRPENLARYPASEYTV